MAIRSTTNPKSASDNPTMPASKAELGKLKAIQEKLPTGQAGLNALRNDVGHMMGGSGAPPAEIGKLKAGLNQPGSDSSSMRMGMLGAGGGMGPGISAGSNSPFRNDIAGLSRAGSQHPMLNGAQFGGGGALNNTGIASQMASHGDIGGSLGHGGNSQLPLGINGGG